MDLTNCRLKSGGLSSATTFCITTLSITTVSKMGLFVTLSINDIQHNVYRFIMLSVVLQSVAIT